MVDRNGKTNQFNLIPSIVSLLSMLLITRPMGLGNINCISSCCSIDKLSFPPFSIFSFLLWLPISFSVSQIIKELCSFSYSFHVRHLSFNEIMKNAIFLLEYDQLNWFFYLGAVSRRFNH